MCGFVKLNKLAEECAEVDRNDTCSGLCKAFIENTEPLM